MDFSFVDDSGQPVVSVETAPTLPGSLGELEGHG